MPTGWRRPRWRACASSRVMRRSSRTHRMRSTCWPGRSTYEIPYAGRAEAFAKVLRQTVQTAKGPVVLVYFGDPNIAYRQTGSGGGHRDLAADRRCMANPQDGALYNVEPGVSSVMKVLHVPFCFSAGPGRRHGSVRRGAGPRAARARTGRDHRRASATQRRIRRRRPERAEVRHQSTAAADDAVRRRRPHRECSIWRHSGRRASGHHPYACLHQRGVGSNRGGSATARHRRRLHLSHANGVVPARDLAVARARGM